MTTAKQRDAARANGAKSRGPVTAEGKARSSQNALTHGLTAATVVLPGESEHRFHASLASMLAAYAPATDYEVSLIEKMAVLTWQQDRLLAIDTETLNVQIQMMAPALDAETANLSPVTRVTLAYRELSDTSRVLPNLDRHSSRIRRQFNQLRTELLAVQKSRTTPETVPGVSTTGCPTHPPNPLSSDSDSCLLASAFSQKLQNEPTGEQSIPNEQHTALPTVPGTSVTSPTHHSPQAEPTQSNSDSCLLASAFSQKLQNEPTGEQSIPNEQHTALPTVPGTSVTSPTHHSPQAEPTQSNSDSSVLASDFSQKLQNEPTAEQSIPNEQHTASPKVPGTSLTGPIHHSPQAEPPQPTSPEPAPLRQPPHHTGIVSFPENARS